MSEKHWCEYLIKVLYMLGLGWRSGWGAAVLVGRSQDWFAVVSLDFSVTYSFWPYHGPGVDSAPSENEHQEHFLGVKVAGAWGWQPHHLHVLNVMKSGSLNLLEPSGQHRACYGTPLPLLYMLVLDKRGSYMVKIKYMSLDDNIYQNKWNTVTFVFWIVLLCLFR